MFYDIRNTGQLLGWLVGRNAKTNQRLGVDVVSSQDETTVWTGGLDGYVRRWVNPHQQEGAVEFETECQGHNEAVSSVLNHQSGTVIASCSGQRREDNAIIDGPALKIWSLT